MEENTVLIIMKISAYSVLFPTLFAIRKIKHGNFVQKVLSVLIFTWLFFEIAATVVNNIYTNNIPLLHILTIVEFALIAYIYKNSLAPILSKEKIYWIIGLFSFGSLINSVFFENIFEFNAYARAIEALLIILLTLTYFYLTLKDMREKHLERAPLFWISSGLLIYFSSSLFINIYSNMLFGFGSNSYTMWGIHAILNIVPYIFYTIALWVKPKP